MRSRSALAVCLLATLLLVDVAGGSVIVQNPGGSVFYPGTDGKQNLSIDGGKYKDYPAGVFDLEADFGDGEGWVPLETFCLEINQSLGASTSGRAYSDPVPLADADLGLTNEEVDYLEILWSNAFDQTLSDKTSAGAFQSIIWELTKDSDVDFLSGEFRMNTSKSFTNDVYQLANTWLGNIDSGTWYTSTPLYALQNSKYQDLLTPIHVPEPTTMILLAIGGLALACRRRQ
ncbi:MAG: PEP-CTERM sorting domain-containing protein [Phycisphaerae bacterium]|nr:PEP-CTERM sorting domain-containing protein [Phycisphaerae bacterium]